jgi:hypothetical protein
MQSMVKIMLDCNVYVGFKSSQEVSASAAAW